jgi:starvation-inducible DNA-binding protein
MQATAMEPGIGITDSEQDTTVCVLNQVLSDEHVLLTKLRNYHWNVTGSHFRELHALFGEQYDIVAIRIDEVAECIRALGAPAVGTMTEYLQRTALREHPGSFPAANEMLRNLLADHEALIRSIREFLAPTAESDLDVGTIGLLTRLIQDHEKMAWVVRATLSQKLDDRQERYSVLMSEELSDK